MWVEKRSSETDEPALSPYRIATILLRRWRLIVFLPLFAAIASVGLTIVFKDYTARSRFAPQSSGQGLGNMAGLAASFGIAVPAGGGEPLEFYVDLVNSGEILRDALLSEFSFRPDPNREEIRSGALVDLLEIEGDTEKERIQNGVDDLKERVAASANSRSGLISLDTQAPWAELAEHLNQRILDLLSDFDRERRQATARAEREFVEERLEAAHDDLKRAEAGMASFLDRNRRPYQSPRLTMQLERQQREVLLKQQLYASLAQAFEEARIEEVRNTPVLTVVDRPQGSARGNGAALLAGLLAWVLSVVLVVGWVFAAEFLQKGTDSRDFEELRRTWRTIRGRDPDRVEEPAA